HDHHDNTAPIERHLGGRHRLPGRRPGDLGRPELPVPAGAHRARRLGATQRPVPLAAPVDPDRAAPNPTRCGPIVSTRKPMVRHLLIAAGLLLLAGCSSPALPASSAPATSDPSGPGFNATDGMFLPV